MPYGTPTRGTWGENLSAAPTITIPSHTAGDLLLLYFAGLADEDTTALTADGWTRVSGADYVEGSLWNAVWEKLGNGVQTSVTVTDATSGGGGVVVVQPGGDVGCSLVYNDDNASNLQAVFTALSGAGYRIGFAPIYGARNVSPTPIRLVSGSATRTTSILGGNFLSIMSNAYRLAIGIFDVSAASSAVFGINWTSGNSNSNGIMVLVPEKVSGVEGATTATGIGAPSTAGTRGLLGATTTTSMGTPSTAGDTAGSGTGSTAAVATGAPSTTGLRGRVGTTTATATATPTTAGIVGVESSTAAAGTGTPSTDGVRSRLASSTATAIGVPTTEGVLGKSSSSTAAALGAPTTSGVLGLIGSSTAEAIGDIWTAGEVAGSTPAVPDDPTLTITVPAHTLTVTVPRRSLVVVIPARTLEVTPPARELTLTPAPHWMEIP